MIEDTNQPCIKNVFKMKLISIGKNLIYNTFCSEIVPAVFIYFFIYFEDFFSMTLSVKFIY